MSEYWKKARMLAFGPLCLTPRQFHELSPLDLYYMLDGYEYRQKKDDERKAFWVANMMSVHTKKPVQPSSLLNILYPEEAKQKDRAEFFEQFKEVLDDVDNSKPVGQDRSRHI